MKIEKCIVYIAASSNPYSPELEGGASYLIMVNDRIIKSSTIQSHHKSQPNLLLLAAWSALLSTPRQTMVELRTSSEYVVKALSKFNSRGLEDIKGKHKDLKYKIYETMHRFKGVDSRWVRFDSGDNMLDSLQQKANDAMRDYRANNNIPLYTQYNTPIERLRMG